MGTGHEDRQLRAALGSAADALWEDEEGPPPSMPEPARRRRGPWRIGVAGAIALVVVAMAIVGAVLANGPGGGGHVATSGPHRTVPGQASAPPKLAPLEHAGAKSNGSFSGAAGTGGTPTFQSPIEAAPSAPASSGSSSSSSSPSSSVPPLPAGIVGQSAKVEMNGSADLTVHRGALSSALASLTNMTVGSGGYVANSSVQTGTPPVGVPPPEPVANASTSSPVAQPALVGNNASANLTLEIPVGEYQGVVNRLGSVGRVTSLDTHAADVTGQYTDLQARITALQASRQQYLTIMTQATTISDILAVQSQIDTLQSQIEQLQGQLNLLDSETTYGTLALSLYEAGTRPAPPRPAPASSVSHAWHDAVHGFLAGVDGIIRISGPLLFVLLCLAVLVLAAFGARRVWRNVHRSQE